MPLDRVTGQETPSYADPSPVSKYMPANASPQYAALLTNLQNLINALAVHPALREAMAAAPASQPPPREKQNKVYFMHDSVSRSRHMLLQIDPELRSEKAHEDFHEMFGRTTFTKVLVNDTSGKLSAMTNETPGEELDFGQEVKDATLHLTDVPEELR